MKYRFKFNPRNNHIVGFGLVISLFISIPGTLSVAKLHGIGLLKMSENFYLALILLMLFISLVILIGSVAIADLKREKVRQSVKRVVVSSFTRSLN